MSDPSGVLWIVPTPIGNQADLSPRAAAVLTEVDLIACEDTRYSARLLAQLGVTAPRVSLHEHNESRRVKGLLAHLAAGEQIALISDAGTPLISDPGFELVAAVHAAGLAVRALPGPCAAITALSAAGLASDRFVFEGFLPAQASARRRRLTELADEPRTLIVYEAGRRIAATATDCCACLGADRAVSVARELTKRFEECARLRAGALSDWLVATPNRQRGEFVLCIAGAPKPAAHEPPLALDTLLSDLLALTGTREAAAIAARATGVSRNQAYRRALVLQGQ